MTHAESPLTELDAALDEYERLNWRLGKADQFNVMADALGTDRMSSSGLKQQIARQREIVRRIAKGEQE